MLLLAAGPGEAIPRRLDLRPLRPPESLALGPIRMRTLRELYRTLRACRRLRRALRRRLDEPPPRVAGSGRGKRPPGTPGTAPPPHVRDRPPAPGATGHSGREEAAGSEPPPTDRDMLFTGEDGGTHSGGSR